MKTVGKFPSSELYAHNDNWIHLHGAILPIEKDIENCMQPQLCNPLPISNFISITVAQSIVSSSYNDL